MSSSHSQLYCRQPIVLQPSVQFAASFSIIVPENHFSTRQDKPRRDISHQLLSQTAGEGGHYLPSGSSVAVLDKLYRGLERRTGDTPLGPARAFAFSKSSHGKRDRLSGPISIYRASGRAINRCPVGDRKRSGSSPSFFSSCHKPSRVPLPYLTYLSPTLTPKHPLTPKSLCQITKPCLKSPSQASGAAMCGSPRP